MLNSACRFMGGIVGQERPALSYGEAKISCRTASCCAAPHTLFDKGYLRIGPKAMRILGSSRIRGYALPASRASYSFAARRAATIPPSVVETGPSESVLAKKTRFMG
jgi:hypothetical protein